MQPSAAVGRTIWVLRPAIGYGACVAAIFRISTSPFSSAFRIAASVAVLIVGRPRVLLWARAWSRSAFTGPLVFRYTACDSGSSL